ncbi:hypothetical protein [Falsiphaeobacter marinintestinus]|uniref:hypothetical protein n=1 Tax=Falsiphaeobacter marinintestinus TaxID=1492905 RepID=UPI0011B359FD|nr:hypothetical protein [Phaeobacter marinintestinus]
MTYAATLKRAARHNPAWKPVSVYTVAVDEQGRGITDAAGIFEYDLSEETYGLRDFTRDDTFIIDTNYSGDADLTIISEAQPDDRAVILYDGIFYQVTEIRGTDAMGGTIKYRVQAVPTDQPVPIRNNSL